MVIHDFDMARWLLGEEPIEVMATASRLVDPGLAELDDFDTIMVQMRTASGRQCHINCCREAVYGYDPAAGNLWIGRNAAERKSASDHRPALEQEPRRKCANRS